MVTSDFRPEVEIQPFRACAMHLAIIWNSSFSVDVAMGQIPHYAERISSFSDISVTAILAGITRSESVKVRHSLLVSENLTVTWKRCKLVLITNGKSYMSFRLLLKSVSKVN